MISWMVHPVWLVLTYDLLENRCINDIIVCNVLLCYHKVTHESVPHVPFFCSFLILMSPVIYYWTDTPQHGIYLLTRLFVRVQHGLVMTQYIKPIFLSNKVDANYVCWLFKENCDLKCEIKKVTIFIKELWLK